MTGARLMGALRRLAVTRTVIVFILAMSVAVPMAVYIQLTVSEIRRGLPVEVLRQKHEISFMLHDLGDLLRAVDRAVVAPDGAAERRGEITERLSQVETRLVQVRRSYRFDNLIGASAMHAVVDPALRDMRLWLSEGVHGISPASPIIMELVRQRLGDAEQQVRQIFDESDSAALDLLQREENRLAGFAWIVMLLFAGALGMALIIVVYMVRQRRSEALVRTAQQRLSDAIESTADGFALFDAEGRVVLTNKPYRDLHPLCGQSLTPGRFFEAFLQDSVASGEILDAKADPDGWLAWRLEHFWNRRQGPIEVTLADGRIMRISERSTHDGGISAISSDVTDLRRSETALRQLSEQLQRNNLLLDAALDNMVQGLAMFDENQALIICNKRYLELYDLPPEFGRPGADLREAIRYCRAKRGDDPAKIEARIKARTALVTAREDRVELDFLNSERILELRHRPLANGGSLTTYDDVTERYNSQEALRRAKEEAEIANRAKSDFLANISHELRTPLNAIIGFSEILEGELYGTLGDPRYKDYSHDIRESGEHLLSLINDILDLSKIEAGKYALMEDVVDLQEITRNCLRIVTERAHANGVTLKADLPESLPPLLVDQRALKQILINLLSNAVKFTPSGGETRVEARQEEDGTLRLEVVDSGIGMSEEDIARALTPFEQADSALSRKYEGTGLGLPLSQRLAALHDAEVVIESEVGTGTRVAVRFPAARVLKQDAALLNDLHATGVLQTG